MHERLVGVAQVVGVRLQAPQLHADAVQLERQVVHLGNAESTSNAFHTELQEALQYNTANAHTIQGCSMGQKSPRHKVYRA